MVDNSVCLLNNAMLNGWDEVSLSNNFGVAVAMMSDGCLSGSGKKCGGEEFHLDDRVFV